MADQNLGGGNPGFVAYPATLPIMAPLFNGAAGDGTAGNGDGNNQPGAGGGNPNPNSNAAGGGQPVAGAGGGGEQKEKVYTFKEDRSDWLPRTRLNEETSKRTRAEQERDAVKAQIEERDRKIAALAGVAPQDPKAKETEELRAAMYEMFPQLQALEKLTGEQLQDVLEAAQSARGTAQATWERHAEEMFTNLEGEISEKIGVDKLTPTQQRNLRRAYREEAQMCLAARQKAAQQGDSSYDVRNDFISRHERGDKSLIKEFAKAFLDDWYTPAVRSVTARQTQRIGRPLPRGERTRHPIATGEQKVDLTNETEFKKALLSARGGGQE